MLAIIKSINNTIKNTIISTIDGLLIMLLFLKNKTIYPLNKLLTNPCVTNNE